MNENKTLDLSMLSDTEAAAVKNGFDLFLKGENTKARYFGYVDKTDMKRFAKIFGYIDKRSLILGAVAATVGCICGVIINEVKKRKGEF